MVNSRQQQQASDGDSKKQQMGEGSYEGTRDYNNRTKEYLKKNDVEADAAAAKPQNRTEAEEMQNAEKEGLSHSKAKGQ